MRDKQTFLMKGSFALLLFVILGYMVKFYPETLVGFDQPIQTAVRGDLPDYLTILFRAITRLIDIPVIITWVAITAFVFYRKRWKIESFFMLGNLPAPTTSYFTLGRGEGIFLSKWPFSGCNLDGRFSDCHSQSTD